MSRSGLTRASVEVPKPAEISMRSVFYLPPLFIPSLSLSTGDRRLRASPARPKSWEPAKALIHLSVLRIPWGASCWAFVLALDHRPARNETRERRKHDFDED